MKKLLISTAIIAVIILNVYSYQFGKRIAYRECTSILDTLKKNDALWFLKLDSARAEVRELRDSIMMNRDYEQFENHSQIKY